MIDRMLTCVIVGYGDTDLQRNSSGCPSCGYCLRGLDLSTGHKCPECGKFISSSDGVGSSRMPDRRRFTPLVIMGSALFVCSLVAVMIVFVLPAMSARSGPPYIGALRMEQAADVGRPIARVGSVLAIYMFIRSRNARRWVCLYVLGMICTITYLFASLPTVTM